MLRSVRASLVLCLLTSACGELPPPPVPPALDAGAPPDLRPTPPDEPDAGVAPNGNEDASPPPPIDAGRPPAEAGPRDPVPDAAASCPPGPPPDDAWLSAYLEEMAGKLTGQLEYEPGKRLADRASIANRAAARAFLGKVFGDLGLAPQAHDYGTGVNVFAILPATTGHAPHVVLGAHFDTVPGTAGANDNASGTAAVLAAARLTKQMPCRSRALMFVLFDEEEVGIIGSKRFARKLSDDGTAVHSVHTVDQIAWDEDKDRLVELERGDPDLRQLYVNAVKALGVTIPLLPTTTGSTDHVSFRPRFPAIGITEGYRSGDTSPHRHRVTDTYRTIDFAYLRSTTTLINRVMVDLVR